METQPLSKADAQAALEEISAVIHSTQKAIASGPAAPLLMIWGFIWLIGYSVNHFVPRQAGFSWLILVLLGSLISWWVGVRTQSPVKSPNDAKIGFFWLALFAYAIAWLFLLAPEGLPRGEEWVSKHPFSSKQIGAFFATVPMFAYVVGGIWFGRFFVWLGLVVTALTLGGYFLLHEHFYIWMAVTGGGSLIGAGLYVRAYWK